MNDDGRSTAVACRAAAGYAGAALGTAVLWDMAGHGGALPPWWPPVSYVLIGLGIAAGSVAALLRVLQRRRGAAAQRLSALAELAAIGVFLAAWVLRGDAEIPPDPPLVVAQAFGLLLFSIAAVLRRRGAQRGVPRAAPRART
jgi:hypothetical protein